MVINSLLCPKVVISLLTSPIFCITPPAPSQWHLDSWPPLLTKREQPPYMGSRKYLLQVGQLMTLWDHHQQTLIKLPYQGSKNQHVPVLFLHSIHWGDMPHQFNIRHGWGGSLSGRFHKASIKFTWFITQWQHYSARQAGLGPLACSPQVNSPQVPKKVPVGEHNVFSHHLS